MTWTLITHDITTEQLKKFQSVGSVAIDTETMGLDIKNDRLCLVQLSSGDATAQLVQFPPAPLPYRAPNLITLLTDPKVVKIFHFARFDLAVLYHYLGVMPAPFYCTKLVSRLVRKDVPSHSLLNITKDLLGVALSKEQQQSNWGLEKLSTEQLDYAASDVLYLHQIKEKLESLSSPEDKKMINECFRFLPTRVMLDLHGFADTDIFAHH